jgi:hypothetical protein
MRRTVAFILVLIILIGGAVLAYRFFSNLNNEDVKTLTIKEGGEFDPEKLTVTNDEKLQIKNEDSKKHTIKNDETKETVAEVEAGQTSEEIELGDNTSNRFYLADKADEKTLVLVGLATEPEQNGNGATTPPPPPPSGQNGGTATPPPGSLPNTGAESLLFPLLVIAGFLVFKVSKEIG